jgi:hypothetical protein
VNEWERVEVRGMRACVLSEITVAHTCMYVCMFVGPDNRRTCTVCHVVLNSASVGARIPYVDRPVFAAGYDAMWRKPADTLYSVCVVLPDLHDVQSKCC